MRGRILAGGTVAKNLITICPECETKILDYIESYEPDCVRQGDMLITNRNTRLYHIDETFCEIGGPAAGVRL